MRLPAIQGVIDRRILLNYRVDPQVLALQLPKPFRPQVINDWGMAGVCLIRLTDIRPTWLPAVCGLHSENAAYRAAVEWETDEGFQRGVYVWRRATSSRLNALAGGRVFPGVHHLLNFDARETETEFALRMSDKSGSAVELDIATQLTDVFTSQIFPSLQQSTECICGGSIGYSPGRDPGHFDGLLLQMDEPRFEVLEVASLKSRFFNDAKRFPPGSIHVDHALLMRGIQHRWISQPTLTSAELSDRKSDGVCHTAACSRQ